MDDGGGGASDTTRKAAGTSTATDVSLKQFLTTISLGILGIGVFAWFEIQRRLEILNHENARLLSQQEKTVSQDTYKANEQQRKDEQAKLEEWRKEVDKDRTQSVSREEFNRDNKTEKRAVTGSFWQWIGGIVAIVALIIAVSTFIRSTTNNNNNNSVPPTITVVVP